MKILMLVNWKIEYSDKEPEDKQPPDYVIPGGKYWFFCYFKEPVEVDVIDIRSCRFIEKIEKEQLRFYFLQTLRAIPKLNNYDFILSHGMQSGVVLSLFRRMFKTKGRHIVFDIGSFNSAAESGFALKLMQFASKSIDGLLYHTSEQLNYYQKFFPWIVNKSKFIRFGTDLEFFHPKQFVKPDTQEEYILCVGYAKRDWDTLVQAYQKINTRVKLRLIGHVEEKWTDIKGVEQLSFIPIKDLINQIYQAKFCVLPLESFLYSYGQMTLMQQMALGKCVVAANVPSLKDYVIDGETAVFYEAKNVDSLVEKMQLLINNPELIDKIGTCGKRYLRDNCNERIMAEMIEEYLKQQII